MFVRNSWYVAAWSSQVNAERPLGVTLLGEPVVLFRGRDGTAAALEARCAHRGMNLAHGKIDGDTLVCCYHGLVYDRGGRCVRIPGQDGDPQHIGVRRFPAVERYGAVWLWMGDPEGANPERIFACDLLQSDGSNAQPYYFHVDANFVYVNDNLSDLLHQAYLHNPSFGGDTHSLGETIPEIEERGARIDVKWDWTNVPAPGIFAEHGGIDGAADGWNHSTYVAPSFYINRVGFARAGTGALHSACPQGSGKLSFTVHQLITPETERTTHFFKLVHAGWPPALRAHLDVFIDPVNREDVWACEEQQRMNDRRPGAQNALIPTDRAVVAMRRVLQRLQESESLVAPLR